MPKVTFIQRGKPDQTVEFEHGALPYLGHGLPESFLDVAMNAGVHLEHACGGSCAGAANIRARRGLRGCFVLRCVECCEHLEHGAACSQSTPATLESSEPALQRPSADRGEGHAMAGFLCD